MGPWLLISDFYHVTCQHATQRILTTDCQCDRCQVVDCGRLVMVTTASGEGFPPDCFLIRGSWLAEVEVE